MPQAINIYTLTGQRIDVMPNTTIEINMGGISLLNLQDRTATYSNSFTLPRTPNNEQIFAFASQPTRNNRPEIEVIIQKGLFSKNARLKVLSFEGDYKVSISYATSETLEYLQNTNFYELETAEKKGDVRLANIYTPNSADDIKFIEAFAEPSPIKTYVYPIISGHTLPVGANKGGAFLGLDSLLQILSDNNIIVNGTMFSDPLINRVCFHNPFVVIAISELPEIIMGQYKYDIFSLNSATKTTFWGISDLLKSLAHIFCADVKINNNVITMDSLNFNSTPITIEGLSFSKSLYSGNAFKNYINYQIVDKDAVYSNFGGDSFFGDGEKEKEVLKINSFIPKYFAGTYFGYAFANFESPSIMLRNTTVTSTPYRINTNYYTSQLLGISPLSIAPLYSNLLNPIFANPVILDASGYIDPLKANQIMTTRIINSVQLGGRYWVDSMAYDLVSGNSKLKLIKL